MPTLDPITRTHRKLWDTLTGYDPWAELCETYVRFDGEGTYERVFKEDFSANETPLLALMQGQFGGNPYHFDGSAMRMEVAYDLMLVGLNLDLVLINRIVWLAYSALHLAGPYLGLPGLINNPVTFTGGRFDGLSKSQWKKNTERQTWSGTFRAELLITGEDIAAGTYPNAISA